MADARIVANRFLDLARQRGRSITPMQLLKLVYIAHGWTLGLTDRPLIDQRVEAWQYGPVIRELYNSTRQYGGSAITAPIPAFAGALTPAQQGMIDQVYDLYGHLSGVALSNITHMPDTPWANTYKPGSFGDVIDNAVIAAHYRRLNAERNGAR
jgi:uncharacterized phage-associated protein